MPFLIHLFSALEKKSIKDLKNVVSDNLTETLNFQFPDDDRFILTLPDGTVQRHFSPLTFAVAKEWEAGVLFLKAMLSMPNHHPEAVHTGCEQPLPDTLDSAPPVDESIMILEKIEDFRGYTLSQLRAILALPSDIKAWFKDEAILSILSHDVKREIACNPEFESQFEKTKKKYEEKLKKEILFNITFLNRFWLSTKNTPKIQILKTERQEKFKEIRDSIVYKELMIPFLENYPITSPNQIPLFETWQQYVRFLYDQVYKLQSTVNTPSDSTARASYVDTFSPTSEHFPPMLEPYWGKIKGEIAPALDTLDKINDEIDKLKPLEKDIQNAVRTFTLIHELFCLKIMPKQLHEDAKQAISAKLTEEALAKALCTALNKTVNNIESLPEDLIYIKNVINTCPAGKLDTLYLKSEEYESLYLHLQKAFKEEEVSNPTKRHRGTFSALWSSKTDKDFKKNQRLESLLLTALNVWLLDKISPSKKPKVVVPKLCLSDLSADRPETAPRKRVTISARGTNKDELPEHANSPTYKKEGRNDKRNQLKPKSKSGNEISPSTSLFDFDEIGGALTDTEALPPNVLPSYLRLPSNKSPKTKKRNSWRFKIKSPRP